ncbi:hypothetical protein D8S78_18120 [Natrialba swarupiae]|nr:hypothetical protein [Natrialba swarupiae]
MLECTAVATAGSSAAGSRSSRRPARRRLRQAALEDRGWVEGEAFRYEELGEEGHGSTDTEQKIRAYRIMAEYLDARL